MRAIIFLVAILLAGCANYDYSPYPRGSGIVVCGTIVYTNVDHVQRFPGGTVVVTKGGGRYTEYTHCNASGL
jgi:hypothetical protein